MLCTYIPYHTIPYHSIPCHTIPSHHITSHHITYIHTYIHIYRYRYSYTGCIIYIYCTYNWVCLKEGKWRYPLFHVHWARRKIVISHGRWKFTLGLQILRFHNSCRWENPNWYKPTGEMNSGALQSPHDCSNAIGSWGTNRIQMDFGAEAGFL
jgi:hypothetical protein